MDLHEFIRMTTIINRLAKRALFAEKQMVALEGQCAEWKRIADELKAERNALRSTTIDTAAGHLLDAFGSLANEPRNGAPDAEYRDRIVMKIHAIKLERDALRTECDDLRRVFSLVHGSLGIQQGEHIGNAIDALKKERDELATRLRQSIARGDFAEMRATELTAEIDRLKKPARNHPVAVGEWVQDGHGKKRQVREVHVDWYVLSTGYSWTFDFCTPCDPPEATHDTPEGKQAAESVIRDDRKTEPRPGDTVRLVRVPTPEDCPEYDSSDVAQMQAVRARIHTTGVVIGVAACGRCVRIALSSDNEIIKAWPISCIAIVEDAK